jgi:hypothetical protein
VHIDHISGVINALAEGQVVIRAIGGGARADIFVNVFAAVPKTSGRAMVAPLAIGPATAPAPAPEATRSAAPSPEDTRAKAADALRTSANDMVAALKAKDGATVTQLFGDGNNADAADLVKVMKDQFGFSATVVQIDPAQMSDRSGAIDYRLTVSWVTPTGLTRTRNVSMRAEAEQRGDAWNVVRHRIASGWR